MAGNTRSIGRLGRLAAHHSFACERDFRRLRRDYQYRCGQHHFAGLRIPSKGASVHAAKAGDTVTIYCVGFGQTSPAAIDGAASNFLRRTLQTNQAATVTFGGGFYGSPPPSRPSYTGLTPGSVGLYQVDATLPPDVPLGNTIPVTVDHQRRNQHFRFYGGVPIGGSTRKNGPAL